MKKARKYLVIIAFVVVAAGIICGILLLGNRRGRGEEENSAVYEEITMVLPTYGYVPEHMDEIVDALNEISMRKAGVKVNVLYTGSTELNHSCLMRLKAGENIDLMPVLENAGLSELMEAGLLAPLQDLMAEYAPEILEITYPRVWDALGSDGNIYAVAVGGTLSDWGGFILMKDVAEAAGLDPEAIEAAILQSSGEDVISRIRDVVTPVLEQCRNSDGILPDGSKVSQKQLTPGLNGNASIFSQLPVIDYDGYGNLFGVTLGTGDQIVNLFETDAYADQIRLLKEWDEKGYLYHLQSTIDEDPAVVYHTRDRIGLFTSLGIVVEEPGKMIDYGDEFYYPFVKKKLTSEFFRVGTWVIPAASEHQEAAMKILKLMYSDEEYVRAYHGNVEGVADYKAPLTWLFGNFLLVDEDYEATKAKKDVFTNMEFTTYFGFSYNPGEKSETIAALQQILDAYLPLIENGIVDDVDQTLQELNSKLYDAGLQEIMEDKQAQLDAWIQSR